MLPSAVTITDVSDMSGTPFLSHSNVGSGTPLGAEQRISARPPASTRTDVGGTENCFLMSEKKRVTYFQMCDVTSVALTYYYIGVSTRYKFQKKKNVTFFRVKL